MRKKRYKKKYGFKKRKSMLKKTFFWVFLLFAAGIGASIYFFFFSPAFQIKNIKISGEIQIPLEDIKKMVFEQSGKKLGFLEIKNIFLVNLDQIKNSLMEKFPRIAIVNLEKRFPDVLAARIEERKAVAIFPRGEECYSIDKDGVIFEKSEKCDNFFKVINEAKPEMPRLGKEIISKELMKFILESEAKLKNNFNIQIELALVVSQSRLNIETSEGWSAYFNLDEDLEWQLTELTLLLKEKVPSEKRKGLQYIDLRFDKIYIY